MLPLLRRRFLGALSVAVTTLGQMSDRSWVGFQHLLAFQPTCVFAFGSFFGDDKASHVVSRL